MNAHEARTPVRRRIVTTAVAVLLTATGLATTTVAAPAQAAVDPAGTLLIDEVYGGGGNSGAPLSNDFVELVNTGSAPVDVSGYSVQYAPAAGTNWSGRINLTGSIPAGTSYLVQAGTNDASVGSPLPTPDATGSTNFSATSGNVALVSNQTALTCTTTACATDPAVVDLVGYGTGAAFAGDGPAPAPSNTASITRSASHANTANNAADFTTAAPTPTGTGGGTGPTEPTEHTIEEIQGTGSASPFVGDPVTTDGIVTAAYPTGGFNGYTIQTPGTGGPIDLSTHTASDGIFVFSSSTVGTVHIGDHVQVTGTVSEFNDLTEIGVTSAAGLTVLPTGAAPVTPATTDGWPGTDAQRESLEQMLYTPSGPFTVSDTFSTDQFGEVGLAAGTTPLRQWTDAARPSTPEADAVKADNAARGVTLDDGASTNFTSAANRTLTPPYVSLTEPVRVGEPVAFTRPLIVDYRNDLWKLQPTAPVGPDTATDGVDFTNTRTSAPDAASIGASDLRVASFNVLNYFTTLGDSDPSCVPFLDNDGNGNNVQSGCDLRGAWDAEDLDRQQTKIVSAITSLDADVVGLSEIENSAVVDGTPDEALAHLVDALNAHDGAGTWAYVPSSTELPPVSTMDVITNAIIYRPAAVTPVGAAHALGDQSGSGQAFDIAREPIAQEFRPASGGTPFLFVMNHFKSKGSAGSLPGDADSGDGQGASNATRVAEATALRDWIPTVLAETDTTDVVMAGDYNSYTKEDPLQVLYDAGYTDVESHFDLGKSSYSFDGLSGSLDHVLVNAPALARSTGADIWNINAGESVALEYSRHNEHGTLYDDPGPYRSSDHDPVVLGLTDGGGATATTLAVSPTTTAYRSAHRPVLHATVVAEDETVPTGTVDFEADGQVLASATLAGGSAATALPLNTPAGTYEIVARYRGSDTEGPSGSAPVTVTVTKARPYGVLFGGVLVSTSPARTAPLVAAFVARDGGVLEGSVRFTCDSDVVGEVPLVSSVATISVHSTGTKALRWCTADFIPTDPANVEAAAAAERWPVFDLG